MPKDWTRENVEDVAEELVESIGRRQEEQLELGEHGPHRRRINEEEKFLRQLEHQLENSCE